MVLRDIPATTIAIYPDASSVFHFTPAILVSALRRMGRIRLWGNRAGSIFSEVYAQYVLACLDNIGADVVLTFIDNSNFFHHLTLLDSSRTYYAIQNGTRTLFCVRDSLPLPPNPSSVISMTHFFCFGQRDVEMFQRHGHRIDVYHPIGSLIGGYYKTMVSKPATVRKYDLCLISQWHEHFFNKNVIEERGGLSTRTASGIMGLNSFVARLVAETGLKLVICPRNDCSVAEVAFYHRIFGEEVEIVSPDRRNFSTYKTVEQSRLAIALNSSTLAEVFSWGQKVLWCNVPRDELFEMKIAGSAYFEGDDYFAFKQHVLELLDLDPAEFAARTREPACFINHFDPTQPAHEHIRTKITEVLNGSSKFQSNKMKNKSIRITVGAN